MAGLVLCGIGGGLAVEILRFYRIRDDLHKGAPDWSKSWLYWAVTLAMIALGGVLVGLGRRGSERSPGGAASIVSMKAPFDVLLHEGLGQLGRV